MIANQQAPHVVVVGSGIAGLTAAYTLQEQARGTGQPVRITLLEGDVRTGGKIVTETVDGFVIEGGPDSLLAQKPWAAELCRRLGLEDELIGTNDERRNVYVLSDGQLHTLPEGMALIAPTRLGPFLRSPLFSWRGKLRMLLDLVLPRRKARGDESVAAFVRRRLGQEAVNKLAEPLLAGIHAGDPERQSLIATFPRFVEMERKHRSLILGSRAARRTAQQVAPRTGPASTFLSLRGGISRLTEALEAALTDVAIRTGVRVISLRHLGGHFSIGTAAGDTYEADAVILATPAYVSSGLLKGIACAPAAMLDEIRYLSTATVSLGFRRAEIAHPLDGFGFVIPRSEGRAIFGCTWSSTKFDHRAPDDAVLIRCFVGGSGQEELVELDDMAMVRLVRDELRDLLGIDAEPVVSRVFRWRRSNPQYDVGHLERVREIMALLRLQPGVYLTGSAYEGVGVPDCVRHAQETARATLAGLPARAVAQR